MMRSFKVVFLSFLLMGFVILVFSFFIPSSTKLSRGITIKKPLIEVKNNLKQIQNWHYWHKGLAKEDIIEIDTIGYSMLTKKVQLNLKNETDTSLEFNLKMVKGPSLLSSIILYNHNDSCSIQWFYTFKSKWYPWEKFASLFHNNIYGNALDSNLIALKNYIEIQK